MLFFSRDVHKELTNTGVKIKASSISRCNVVGHASYVSPRTAQRTRVWGTACNAKLQNKFKLMKYATKKPGVGACHLRISTDSTRRNNGKYLVFDSSNVIRAGKHTHGDAVRCMFMFNAWLRKVCDTPHVWHTAIGCPNMVLSGKLLRKPPTSFKDHWRCNYSSKFPGVAVQTDERITPEVYPKSGAYIVPGVTKARGAVHALKVVDEIVSGTQCDASS
jgi:hypothetical protein